MLKPNHGTRSASAIFKVASLFILVALHAGCLPFPHRATISPAIVGKVHRNEMPIENAIVYVEKGTGHCSFQSNVLAHTNAQGEFCLQPRKEFRFFAVMDPAYSWRVCIAEADKRYEGWTEAGLGYPADMTLNCDLEKQTGKGVCIANSQPKTKPQGE